MRELIVRLRNSLRQAHAVVVSLASAMKTSAAWIISRWNGFARSNRDGVELLTAILIGVLTLMLVFQGNRVADGTRTITDQQRAIMEQQLESQKFNAMPNFVLTNYHSSEERESEPSITEITNTGGWARYATVETVTFAWVVIIPDDGSDPVIVVTPPFTYLTRSRIDFGDNQEPVAWEFSSQHVEERWRYFVSELVVDLENDYVMNVSEIFTDSYYIVNYTDYQGEMHEEIYTMRRTRDEDSPSGYPYLIMIGNQEWESMKGEFYLDPSERDLNIPSKSSDEDDAWDRALDAWAKVVVDRFESAKASRDSIDGSSD